MNHDPRFPTSDDEREWSAQERALADERAGLDPNAGDPRRRAYRLVARALAQPLEEQLPTDFARRVARRVEPATPAADGRLERCLFALLALAGLASIVVYGAAWLPLLDAGAAGALAAKPWLWALAACLAFSRLSRRWLDRSLPA